MNTLFGKRILSMVLAVCMVLSLIPTFVSEVEVEANALSVSSLTCSAYISNATARSYIDKMMKYYITSSSTLQSTLNNGQCVIFMFEGGSDNYWTGSDYANSSYDVRIQAAVFVVKLDSSGNAYVDFCSETCSSIPTYAPSCTEGVAHYGSTTILDGIYRAYRWDHTGPYAAFQLDVANSNAGGLGLYTPSTLPDGQLLGCSGINVHTRSTTSGSIWSEGCQLIGTGNDSSNEFNSFFKSVTGFSFNPWISWSPKSLNTYGSYGYSYGSSYTVGYYVVDRQLGMLGVDGTKYGTGSLNEIYNTTALSKLTSYSTAAAEAAGALDMDYISANCTYYPAHCKIKVTLDQAPVNALPCSLETTSDNETLETPAAGTTYTATGLYKNSYGNYWYRVITSSGETGYIYGGEVSYVEQLTSDITLTNYDTPNGHVSGDIFYVTGTIASTYNKLNTAAVWIHSGFGTTGTKITGSSDTVSGNKYVLDNSNIDYNTAFNEVSTGKYTYAISVNYTNYYAEGATTLKENTDTLYLCDEYFVVISSSVSQSTCSHSYSSTTIGEATCTGSATVVKSCSKCGYITETTTTGSHSYGDWTVTKAATCGAAGTKTRSCSVCGASQTETIAATGSHSYGSWVTVDAGCTTAGSKTRTCSVCGDQQTETTAAIGHNYSLKVIDATCSQYAIWEYTCGNCGDSYSYNASDLASTWMEEIPEGMDASLFKTKTQYRYADKETTTSYSTALDGWTQAGSQWIQSGTKTVNYVKSWPAGFLTSNSLYSTYNKSSSKVSASETTTTKTVINSDAVVGYLWYHWCTGQSEYTSTTNTGSYTTFHAFYSTTATPTNYDNYDPSDDSYKVSDGTTCSCSDWYWPIEVYAQKSTNYNKQFTYERWGAYSDWSDTVATASDTRTVETRTLYQLASAEYADHSWVDATCTKAKFCSVCGATEGLPLGHCYEGVLKNPTCTEGGYTTYICSTCGDSFVDDEVAAKGHDYEAVVTASTCTAAGYTTYTCSACGDSYVADEVAALGHTWVDADCDTAKTCSACGSTEGEALGHSYTESVTTAAGCTTAGVKTFTCSKCGDSYTEEIASTGHSYDAVVTAPTCTEGGYTTYTCSACGDSYVADEVASTGHSWSNGTCGTCGETCTHTWSANECTNCGYTCEHLNTTYTFVKDSTGMRNFTITCADCGRVHTCKGKNFMGAKFVSLVLSNDITVQYTITVPSEFAVEIVDEIGRAHV